MLFFAEKYVLPLLRSTCPDLGWIGFRWLLFYLSFQPSSRGKKLYFYATFSDWAMGQMVHGSVQKSGIKAVFPI